MWGKFERRREKYKLALVAVLFAAACSLMYYFHVVVGSEILFSHFFYIPIILACIWWKEKGLIVAILLSACLILSHIFAGTDTPVWGDFFRAGMFMVVAGVVTVLSQCAARAEQMLRIKDIAMSSSINAIGFVDTEGNITYVNDFFLRLWGYSSEEEVLGKPAVQFWVDTDRAAEVKKIIRDKGAWSGELTARRKDGSVFDVRLSANLVNDQSGNPLCTMASFIDISDQKKSQDQLKQYQFMVEAAHDAIFFKDLKSRYIIANNKTLEAFGLPCEQVIGKNDYEIMTNKAEAGKNVEDDRLVFKTGTPTEITKCMTGADGKNRWFQAVKVPHFDHKRNVTGLIGIARDVTKHKQIEDELLFKTTILEAQSETSIDGILVVDSEGKSISFNKCFGQMWNIPQEILDTKDDKKMLGCVIKQLRNPQEFLEKVEYLYAHKDEKSRDEIQFSDGKVFDRYSSPLLDSNGRYHGRIWYFRDITEHKRTEQELQKARDQLEVRVKQRTFDLARTNEELQSEINERKKAERKLLIYQKQLRSLASELSLAEERLRRRIATDIHDHVGQNLAISKIKVESLAQSAPSPETARALDEIRDLIAQTIESTRSLTFELSPPVLYDLGFEAAVEWLVRQTRRQYGLSTEFEDDGQTKSLDNNVRVLLFQAVREVLLNVVKHARAGNVMVSIRKVGNEIRVSVEDDGVGFDVSKALSQDYKTSGFGLFSIRERLDHIGGYVDINSEFDRGTQVTLVAPINHSNDNNEDNYK